jgi:hypothetical protein
MLNLRPKLSLYAATAVFAVLGAALPAGASATIKLGVFNSGGPTNTATVSNYLSEVARPPAISLWYTDFGSTLLTSEQASVLKETGQAPMVTWEPYNQSLSQIADGSYDSYLRLSARSAKAFGNELMIRFAHEMNGTWYPWAGSPTTYVAAWRHIVSIFREEGASNVRWVWAPNVDRTGSMPFSSYFPGEEWVDYIGLDGYNFGSTPEDNWQSLEEVFSASYTKITALSAKPLIITETGSNEVGGSKAEWIRTGFMKTIPQRFPRVTGVIWFNKEQAGINWSIDSSQSSLEAFREVANCTIYGGSVPCDSTVTTPVEEPVSVTVQVPGRVKGKAPKKRSVRLSYRLSRNADVHLRLQLHKGHGKVRRGTLIRSSRAGRTSLPLRSLIGHRKLVKGVYSVTAIAHGADGRTSRPRHASFRVL